MKISIVIAVYNEEENVKPLFLEVNDVLKKLDYEIVFVDDGSKDKTFYNLSQIKDDHLKIIKLRKNFGQSSAWMAGFDAASGDIIVTLDGDLQNDPKDIPLLLEKINEGYDCVSGWRWERKDDLITRLMSRTGNLLRHKLINDQINDSGCSLKAYRKECLKDIELYGEMHRYIVSLVALKGFKVTEVKVNHRPRISGKTKYNIYKVVKGFLDLWGVWFWQKFAGRPMHLFGLMGFLTMLAGFASSVYVVYLKIFRQIDLSDTFLSIVAVFLIVIGIQLFALSLLADILIKNYMKGKKPYSIERVVRK